MKLDVHGPAGPARCQRGQSCSAVSEPSRSFFSTVLGAWRAFVPGDGSSRRDVATTPAPALAVPNGSVSTGRAPRPTMAPGQARGQCRRRTSSTLPQTPEVLPPPRWQPLFDSPSFPAVRLAGPLGSWELEANCGSNFRPSSWILTRSAAERFGSGELRHPVRAHARRVAQHGACRLGLLGRLVRRRSAAASARLLGRLERGELGSMPHSSRT